MIDRERIDAVKQEGPTISALWRQFKLRGEPGLHCRSPFREDKHPSFSIYDQGRRAKDFGTGETFDGPAFVAKALGLSNGEGFKWFMAMAGGDTTKCSNCSFPNETNDNQRDAARRKPDLSKFQLPLLAEIRAIACDRELGLAGPAIAKRLGCLKTGDVCGYHSWILSDPAAWNAEARRFGALPYPACGVLCKRKAHTIRNSLKSWPVGLGVDRTLVEKAALIAIVEGGPDLLAAWHFVYRTKRWDVLPIAILGRAIHGLHPDALVLLKGKRIKFFPHVDLDDGALKQIELIGEQLRKVGCQPTYFDLTGLRTPDGKPVKDLNDLAQLDPNQLSELRDLFL